MFAKYSPTKALLDAHFIATGVRLHHTERIEFDPVTLTPEQRAVLTRCAIETFNNESCCVMPERTTGVSQQYRDSGPARYHTERADEFDTLPAIADWIERAGLALASREPFTAEFDRLAANHREQLRGIAQVLIDDATVATLERIEKRIPALAGEPARWRLDDARKAGATLDLSAYDAAVNAHHALLGAFRAEADARAETEKAAKEAQRAADRAARLEWARQHGSDRLRRNLELGHDCKRLYTIERAALEFPGYVPDIEKNYDSKPVTCATSIALDERDAVLAAHPGLIPERVTIEWATSEPRARKLKDEQAEYFDGEFEPCECIAIDSPDYDCFLVKLM